MDPPTPLSVPSPPGSESLELLLGEVRAESDLHQRHWDAADTKAAAVGGFAASIVALAAGSDAWYEMAGQVAAGMSTGFALWAAMPRRMPLLQVKPLFDHYLHAPVLETKHNVLMARVDNWVKARELLKLKAERLRVAVVALWIAGGLLIVGTLSDSLARR